MPGEHTFFAGSKLLTPISNSMKMPIDQVNFVFCLFLCLPLSVLYYHLFCAERVSRRVRLFVPFILGLGICLFCFGPSVKHVIADTVINYLIILYAPPRFVHKFAFVFSMGYLSFIHFYRVYFTGDSYVIDITGEVPSVLEYLSYIFQFQSILCGPLCFFTDYMAFIDGHHFQSRLKAQNPELIGNPYFGKPAPHTIVFEKVVISVFFMVVAIYGVPLWPVDAVTGSPLKEANYIVRMTYVVLSMFFARTQYYSAWVLADALNNASGFGFNGYDENGQPRWDLVSNVKIWQCETATSFREALEGWNCTTMHWLRRVAYDRAPKDRRTLLTYLLSAWWHGFFLGYYMTFLTGALFTMAGRAVRRSCRGYFLDSDSKKLFYDYLTLVGQKLAIGYVAFPFVMLKFWPALQIYKNLYFSLHIGALFAVLVLPKILPPTKKPETKTE